MLETSFKTGSFEDWLGQEHKFVVAAVIVDHAGELVLASVGSIPGEGTVVVPVDERGGNGHVRRSVFIGYSICNPGDRYDEKLGMRIAANRAVCGKFSQRWIATDRSTMITPELIDVLLTQEVAYIAGNPGKIIKGYDEARARHERKQLALGKFATLPASGQALVKAAMEGVDLTEIRDLAGELRGEGTLPPPADTPRSGTTSVTYRHHG